MVAGFSFFFLALALYGYLIKVSPSAPDASSDRICPMYEHAYVFFVTADQRFGFAALMGVFALLVLIATYSAFVGKSSGHGEIIVSYSETSNQSLEPTAGRSDD